VPVGARTLATEDGVRHQTDRDVSGLGGRSSKTGQPVYWVAGTQPNASSLGRCWSYLPLTQAYARGQGAVLVNPAVKRLAGGRGTRHGEGACDRG